MPDQITEVVTKGWGSRIMSSIKGIFIGFLFFAASFVVLYWNEGRVDVSKIAETATDISADVQADVALDGQLVAASGVLSTDEVLGDTYLQPGNYLALERVVEMYAWEEESHSETKTNTGGSETTTTTYTYKKDWTSYPQDSADFKEAAGHENPAMLVEGLSLEASHATIGAHEVNMKELSLPPYEDLFLTEDIVILDEYTEFVNSSYLYDGAGMLSNPQVGDLRISYRVLRSPVEHALVFGQLDQANMSIGPFFGKKDTRLYRAFEGTRDSAINKMATEHSIMTWILRLVGFLLMWGGLTSIFAPISVFLDVLPIFGTISRSVIGFIMFVVALILSLLTIFISMIMHNILALILVLVLAFAGVGFGLYWFMKHRKTA